MSEPRTEAGRALLADFESVGPENVWRTGDPQHISERIIAIEREAAVIEHEHTRTNTYVSGCFACEHNLAAPLWVAP